MADRIHSLESSDNPISKSNFDRLLQLMKNIKYGSVTLIIQDGKVVLIETSEKMRLK